MGAPLLISNDLAKVRPEIKELLLNKAIIRVNQDPLGIQGRLVKTVNKIEVRILKYYKHTRRVSDAILSPFLSRSGNGPSRPGWVTS